MERKEERVLFGGGGEANFQHRCRRGRNGGKQLGYRSTSTTYENKETVFICLLVCFVDLLLLGVSPT